MYACDMHAKEKDGFFADDDGRQRQSSVQRTAHPSQQFHHLTMALFAATTMMMGMTFNLTLKRTQECSPLPEFSLVDYADPLRRSHGVDINSDVTMVGFYFAD